jgi:hypothetical protein
MLRRNRLGTVFHDSEASQMKEPCKRTTGTYRAWFVTREEAERFAADPANTAYHGDIAHLCAACGYWHLSRPEWLAPEWLTMTTEAERIN